jgi:hypothetical protein
VDCRPADIGASANASSGMVLVRRSGSGWASVPHDVEDGLGMFFAVQRDSVRHLTLLIVTDDRLHVRFESSTRCESLAVLQLLHCIPRRGDDAGWPWPSLLVTLWGIRSTSIMVQTPQTISSREPSQVSSRDLRVCR